MGKTYSFARELGGVLMEEARTVMDILIPRTCIVCGETLTTHEKHLCINCQTDLPLTFFWERKKNPMADKVNAFVQKRIEAEVNAGEDVTPDKTSTAQALPHIHYSFAAALFFYHGENRHKKIPQRLKYMADIDEGAFYAGMLGEFMNDSEHFCDIDFIIPVPLHWARQWKRGYNQAEVIANALAEKLGVRVRTDILLRRKSTKTQTKLGVEAKKANVNQAFTLAPHIPVPNVRHVLLVDDVFTTGATMAACLSVLQPFFGPEVRISCATLGFVNNG